MPESYYGRAVRTTGTLDMLQGSGSSMSNGWALKAFNGRVIVVPVREVAARFEDEARLWFGRDIEITGVIEQGTDPVRGNPTPVLNFWSYYGPEEEKPQKRDPAEELTLEDLLRRPGQWDGRNVRVVGQFRGANLFGDLPSASRRKSSDWVLKNDVFAVWITGKKPEGKGWKLDAKLRRDTGKWIEVEGRVRTSRGVVYISAADLVLTKAPSPTARAEAPPPPPPPPLKPPVIVFSLPLDGERDIPPDTVFLGPVQQRHGRRELRAPDRAALRGSSPPRRPGARCRRDLVRPRPDKPWSSIPETSCAPDAWSS